MVWGIAALALIVAVIALRRSARLVETVDQLKRDQYDAETRLRRLSVEMKEMVEPLRLHLATVAEGGRPPRDMILDGRLYRDLSAEEVRRAMEQADGRNDAVLLLDVRTPREHAARRIPGARLLPFEELESRYEREVPKTVERIIVYCEGGERSRSACEFLGRRGYANLFNLKGGLGDWRGPTEGEGAPTPLIPIESLRKPAPSR
jgi:rhodanese-related sulfurtransferase